MKKAEKLFKGLINENYIDLKPINKIEATPKTSFEIKFAKYLAEEAKAVEKKTTKEVDEVNEHGFDAKDKSNLDNQIGQEVQNGVYFEAKQNPDKSIAEIKEIVSKNLEKDGQYYMKNAAFGIEGLGYQEAELEEVSGKYASSGYSDKLKKVVKESLIKENWASYNEVKEEEVEEEKEAPIPPKTKKIKKETIDSKLAEIGKEAEAVKLEAQLDFLHDHIQEKVDRVNSISEDENLSELVDKAKMKQMQKDIKELEKRKSKMERIYEKSCGKKYAKKEMVDETEEMFESVDLKDLMKDGKINNDILVTTKPGASKEDQMKNSLRPKSIEDNSENAGPGAKLVRFADLAGGSDKDYKVENGKIVDVSLINDI